MSKELLLTYAKGGKAKQNYNVQYEVNPSTGKIKINVCVPINYEPEFWIKIVHTKEEAEFEVSKEDVETAIEEFMSNKNI